MKNNGLIQNLKFGLLIFSLFIVHLNSKANCAVSAAFSYFDSSGFVTFTNTGNINNCYLIWDYGKGHLNFGKHILYPKAGKYTVMLQVFDTINKCSDTYFDTITITNNTCYLKSALEVKKDYSKAKSINVLSQNSPFVNKLILDYGDGVSSSFFNKSSHTYSTEGTYTVKLLLYDTTINGCIDSMSKNIVVYHCPVKSSFSTVENINMVKFNQVYDYYANFKWQFGDGNNSNDFNPSHTYNDDGAYTVKLIYTNRGGFSCSDTFTKRVLGKSCKIKAAFTIEKPKNPKDMQFVNLSQCAYQYDWSFGDSKYSSNEHPYHTYDNEGIYAVKLIVSDTLIPNCKDTFEQSISVFGCRLVNKYKYNSDDQGNYIFQNSSSYSTKMTWTFYKGSMFIDSVVSDSFGKKFKHCATTTVLVRSYDSIGNCESIDVFNFNPKNLFPKFSISKDSLNRYAAIIKDESKYIEKPNYTWDFGDGNTADNKWKTHKYNATSLFQICLKLSLWDCNETFCSSIQFDSLGYLKRGIQLFTVANFDNIQNTDTNVTSIDKVLQVPFSVFPNPFDQYVKLSNDKLISKVKVFNAIGQLIFETEPNSKEITIDTKAFKQGLYCIEVTDSDNKKSMQKLLRQ